MLHLRHFVMKEEALLKLNKTRQHSSRMRTACLPTVCVLVATTRCQYCWVGRSSSEQV